MAGADITEAEITWLPVPVGVFPETVLEGFLLVDVASGQPLMPAMLDAAPLSRPAGGRSPCRSPRAAFPVPRSDSWSMSEVTPGWCRAC